MVEIVNYRRSYNLSDDEDVDNGIKEEDDADDKDLDEEDDEDTDDEVSDEEA